MKSALTDIGLSLIILVFATTLGDYFSVADIVPNLPLLWIVALAIRRGQIVAVKGQWDRAKGNLDPLVKSLEN